MKSIFLSKTFWLQIVALAALVFPAVRDNPVEFAAAWAALNVLVRFFTSGAVTLGTDHGPQTTENSFDNLGDGNPPEVTNSAGAGPGAGRALGLIGMVGILGALFVGLPGCSPGAVYPSVSIAVPGHGSLGYSAKGGIAVTYIIPTK
jgi:hypothetical protein